MVAPGARREHSLHHYPDATSPADFNVWQLGGTTYYEGLVNELKKSVSEENTHKHRCTIQDCTKSFKDIVFWHKHVQKRHLGWIKRVKAEQICLQYVVEEKANKIRCKIPKCAKLFKDTHFWRKHVQSRQPPSTALCTSPPCADPSEQPLGLSALMQTLPAELFAHIYDDVFHIEPAARHIVDRAEHAKYLKLMQVDRLSRSQVARKYYGAGSIITFGACYKGMWEPLMKFLRSLPKEHLAIIRQCKYVYPGYYVHGDYHSCGPDSRSQALNWGAGDIQLVCTGRLGKIDEMVLVHLDASEPEEKQYLSC